MVLGSPSSYENPGPGGPGHRPSASWGSRGSLPCARRLRNPCTSPVGGRARGGKRVSISHRQISRGSEGRRGGGIGTDSWILWTSCGEGKETQGVLGARILKILRGIPKPEPGEGVPRQTSHGWGGTGESGPQNLPSPKPSPPSWSQKHLPPRPTPCPESHSEPSLSSPWDLPPRPGEPCAPFLPSVASSLSGVCGASAARHRPPSAQLPHLLGLSRPSCSAVD